MNNSTSFEDAYDGGLYVMSRAEIIIWCVLYASIAVLAVVGNLITIFVIVRNPEMRTVTNIFIINLAVSDVITGIVVIPFKFQAALLQRWNLPRFLCQVVPFIETVSLTVSVLTLCATAIDRYRAVIMKPMTEKKKAIITVLVIWIVSVLFSSPIGIYHRVVVAPFATEYCIPIVAAEYWWKIYNIYLVVLQYFVPLLIVLGTFVGIGIIFKQQSMHVDDCHAMKGFERTMRKVFIMLSIVVAAFTFCWLPLEIYLVLSELLPHVNEFYYINVLFFIFHWLAMCNSCLNPIIFAIFHERFQREYKRLFLQCLCQKGSEETVQFNDEHLLVLGRLSEQLVRSQRMSRRPSESVRAIALYNTHTYFMNELGIQLPLQIEEEQPAMREISGNAKSDEITVELRKKLGKTKKRRNLKKGESLLSLEDKYTF